MPEIQRTRAVPLPIQQVWDFVADMSIWASDVPGYSAHEVLSEKESVWRIRGDVGILSREVELRVLISEWEECSRVTFSLEGTDEAVSGSGSFGVTSDGPAATTLIFDMSLSAGGLMGPVINVLLGQVAPRIADSFVSTLCNHLQATLSAAAEFPAAPKVQ